MLFDLDLVSLDALKNAIGFITLFMISKGVVNEVIRDTCILDNMGSPMNFIR